MTTRRQAIKTTLAAGSLLAAPLLRSVRAQAPAAAAATASGPFKLPDLPYAYYALEPHIDAQTMHLHHDKHHVGLRQETQRCRRQQPGLGEISDRGNPRGPQRGQRTIRKPCATMAAAMTITACSGNDEAQGWRRTHGPAGRGDQNTVRQLCRVQDQFSKEAGDVFGSGWAWLCSTKKSWKSIPRPTRTPDFRGQGSRSGDRCVGTRLLSPPAKPPGRVHRRLVERGELGFRRRTLRQSDRLNPLSSPKISTYPARFVTY